MSVVLPFQCLGGGVKHLYMLIVGEFVTDLTHVRELVEVSARDGESHLGHVCMTCKAKYWWWRSYSWYTAA